eukprot:11694612-Ditylum_brightwellii.AAC.1
MMKMHMRSVEIVFMMMNYQVRDSTGNHTDLTLDENFEVEADRSGENKVETNIARKHRIDKKTLLGLSSSFSISESSEEEQVVNTGEEFQRIINCFPAQKS